MPIPALPTMLAPPAPFPLIVTQSQTSDFVAPGVRRATYRLQTSDGPIVVHVVAIDTREPTVRFGTVLAHDRMISSGETTSSMARRTNAVAGVNADYFDIGNTNQPLGIVIRQGALLRTPSKRVVLDVRDDRSVHCEAIAFSGSVTYGGRTVPLTGINEWPPQGGASLLTADYGAVKASPGVTLAELVPAMGASAEGQLSGTYRVAAIDATAPPVVRGPLLALGPAALALAPPPDVGEGVVLDATTVPALSEISSAVGGGPLLLDAGAVADDPNEPAPEERERRFPVSGAAIGATGELLLASVDGRQPSLSIGVTRPQFAALFLAFDVTSAMAFDSGGSATLVARVLGDAAASVLGSPSDGEERRVADGFFVYSDAPLGPAAQLVVRPGQIVALPQSVVPVRLAIVDAAGHALGAAHLVGGDVVRVGATPGPFVVRAGNVRATVPVDVVTRLARLDVEADVRVPVRDALVGLTALGYDARGRPVELGNAVRWSADRGSFSAPGRYLATDRDARIVATAGGVSTEFALHVGRHLARLTFFDRTQASAWRFATVPEGGRGSLAFSGEPPEMQLLYDFSAGTRAAAANASLLLPGEPLALSVEVRGDASGVGLRAAFTNRFGERRALTLARRIDWNGWQSRTLALPDDLNPPVRLVSLYAVDALGGAPTHAVGNIALRNLGVTLAGNP
jgi:hypothetical protein